MLPLDIFGDDGEWREDGGPRRCASKVSVCVSMVRVKVMPGSSSLIYIDDS